MATAIDHATDFDATGPSAEDLADFTLWTQETAAREYLCPADATLTLAELVDLQAAFYRSWPIAAGEMIARAMEELALKVRMTDATTPAEFEARVEALDADARAQWEAIGYEEGRAAGRGEPAGSAFGHVA
jgi:SRSO17 transposase